MALIIEFCESCIPPKTTAQMKRINRSTGVFFKSGAQETAEATWDQVLVRHRPEQPIRGAVDLTIALTWPWLKGHTKADRAAGLRPHTSKPDLDNLVKMLIDRMVVWGYIENDQSVSILRVMKFWGNQPGVRIKLTRA